MSISLNLDKTCTDFLALLQGIPINNLPTHRIYNSYHSTDIYNILYLGNKFHESKNLIEGCVHKRMLTGYSGKRELSHYESRVLCVGDPNLTLFSYLISDISQFS